MIFSYSCPHCDLEIENGGFGDNVYCENCDKTFETDWDYITEDYMSAWLTGVEYDGKINI
jgi:hypothetical protein